MTDILLLIAATGLVFVLSTAAFDLLHVALHKWTRSKWALLRGFAALHQVHHRFLDKGMRVHPELTAANYWAHLFPEFMATVAGTLVLLPLGALPVALCLSIHLVLFVWRCATEGLDGNHMTKTRLDGRHGIARVTADYHAMHHVEQGTAFGSYTGLVDFVLGTKVGLHGKRIAISGGNGALGKALRSRLEGCGARVHSVERGVFPDFAAIDILILASGSRVEEDAWEANFLWPIKLAKAFMASARDRLVPPEVWGIGSEAEVVGNDTYALSKRAFARYAAQRFATSPDITYRHVPMSRFRSKLSPNFPIPAGLMASLMLDGIRRGLRFVPVTFTGLGLLCAAQFMFWKAERR